MKSDLTLDWKDAGETETSFLGGEEMRLGFLLRTMAWGLGLSLPRPLPLHSRGCRDKALHRPLPHFSSLDWTLSNHAEKIEVLVSTDNVSHFDD